MSQYTTISLLQRRLDPAILAGLADDINTPPDIDDGQAVAVVSRAITDGAAVIEARLAARLDLAGLMAEGGGLDSPTDEDWSPATAAQAALERINATLALYCLYQRRCLSDAANPLRLARELAEAHLRNVANGTEQLGGEPCNEGFSTTAEVSPAISLESISRF
jgi:phage gp36-like protein